MAETNAITGVNIPSVPVGVGCTDPKGPISLPLIFNVTSGQTYLVDLSLFIQQGRISEIQSVFVDNSGNDAALTLTFSGSNQPLIIPAGSQAYLPILAPKLPQINVFSTGSTEGTNVRVVFLNCPVPASVWSVSGQDFTFTGGALEVSDATTHTDLASIITALNNPPGDTGTDYSANAATLPANLILTIPTNTSRKGFVIQNNDTDVAVVLMDDGSGGNETQILLAAASAAGQPGGSVDFSGMPTQGRLRVYSANTAPPISAHDF